MSYHLAVLSPLDQLMPASYIKVFFLIPSQDATRSIAYLQKGLGRTQQQLPYLSGRLVSADSGRPFAVEWTTGEVPLLEEIAAPLGLESISELASGSVAVERLNQLTPTTVAFGLSRPVEETTVLILRYCILQDGIVLSAACHHCLWDVAGLSIFINLWAVNSANSDRRFSSTVLDDLGFRDARIREAITRSSQIGHALSRRLIPEGSPGEQRTSHTILRIAMARLRSKYSPVQGQSVAVRSATTLLYAVLWSRIDMVRTLVEARHVSSKLRILRDARRLLFDDIESRKPYLGNVVQDVFCYKPRDGNSDTTSITQTQLIIDRALQAGSASVQPIADAVSAVDQCHNNLIGLRETAQSYNSDTLTITSWAEAPMFVGFGKDIGQVAAVRIAPADYALDGMIIIMPKKKKTRASQDTGSGTATNSNEDDSVEVFISLHEEVTEKLRRDPILNEIAVIEGEAGKTRSRL